MLTPTSIAPKAVATWKSDLTSKNRSKIAATIADPSENPELFEEGWEAVLQKEEELLAGMLFLLSILLSATFLQFTSYLSLNVIR